MRDVATSWESTRLLSIVAPALISLSVLTGCGRALAAARSIFTHQRMKAFVRPVVFSVVSSLWFMDNSNNSDISPQFPPISPASVLPVDEKPRRG